MIKGKEDHASSINVISTFDNKLRIHTLIDGHHSKPGVVNPSGSLELFQKYLKMETDIATIDTYTMCCLHYKAYIRLLIFCGSRHVICLSFGPQTCHLFDFWSNMALSTFWVAESCSKLLYVLSSLRKKALATEF